MKKYLIIIIATIFFFACEQKVDNQDVEKGKNTDARSNIINASEINKKIKDGKNISYKDATILGEIDFFTSSESNQVTPLLQKYYINSSMIFYNCTFKEKISTQEYNEEIIKVSKFNKNLTFINCTFQDTVNFKSSDFQELVNFSESVFYEFVSFEACAFNYKKNYFNKSKFLKNASFNMIFANGDLNFFESIFEDKVSFQKSKFNNSVNFGASKFYGETDFSGVKFFDDVFFNYSEFIKKISFNNSVFKGRTEFVNVKFNFISEFKDCIYFGKTKYNNSEVIGVFSFKNSIFYLSNPKNFNFDIKNGSDFVLDNTQYILDKK